MPDTYFAFAAAVELAAIVVCLVIIRRQHNIIERFRPFGRGDLKPGGSVTKLARK